MGREAVRPGATTVSCMTKTELYELVDALPDESLPAAAILLRRAQDPVIAKLDAAPYDDEDLTEEDLQAIRQARSEPSVPWSEAEAELSAG
jgi:predicted DNA binding protein